MRVIVCLVSAAALGGCTYSSDHLPRYPRVPEPASNSGLIDPYKRDKTPDTPYEVRKAEMERDDHIAGRTGPTYPKLFKDQKDEDDDAK
jgi:hypothetical protein